MSLITVCQIIGVIVVLNVIFNKNWRALYDERHEKQLEFSKDWPKLTRALQLLLIAFVAYNIFLGE